jgi:thiol-disulfide isomerase/thioredoxin
MKKLLLFLSFAFLIASFQSDYRAPAHMFTLKNSMGQKVSLSDFKGKVVYIDVWATWCRTCLGEIPANKKLMEQYEKNDSIVFINISIDQDKLDWEKYIKAKAVKGVNLYSEGGADESIVERYGIQFIPHYIMIDKEGRIFKNGATHPTDSTTKKQLDALIKE